MIDVHDLLLGQPLRREASYLEEVDFPPDDPRFGLTFSELLTLERQRVQHITPDPSWKGSPWSSPDSTPGPSRTPSPSTGDSNSLSSTAPLRRGESSSFLLSFFFFSDFNVFQPGKPLQREGAFIDDEGVQDGPRNNVPFFDSLGEQRRLALHITPAPSWNLSANDAVPINRGKSFIFPVSSSFR